MSFAELLGQLNARYEADLAIWMAKCEALELKMREDAKAAKGVETMDTFESLEISMAWSKPVESAPSRASRATPWSGLPHLDVLRHSMSMKSTVFTCCDIERLLSLCYLRTSAWWNSLVEPPRSGLLHSLTESKPFRCWTWFVIIVNSIVVTLMTDWMIEHGKEGAAMPWSYVIIDYVCLACYLVELILCLMVHRWYFFVNESAGWNWLHFILVILSAMDLAADWGADDTGTIMYMRSLRFCRVTKAFRIFRVMTSFHELAAMLRSFTSCLWAMLWSFMLLYLLLYLCALIFAQGISESLADDVFLDQEEAVRNHFGSVGRTMLSLYMSVTGGADWIIYYEILEYTGFLYPWLFLAFTFLFTFALVNILTALFVEKAVEGAKPEREYRILHERQKLAHQAAELRELFFKMDLDHSGRISWEEFSSCMLDSNIVAFMGSIGLEVTDAEFLWKLVAGEDGDLEITTFVDTCMAVRGQASTLDVQKQLLSIERISETLREWERRFWPLLHEAWGLRTGSTQLHL